jgi:hypothetical protein
MIPEKERAVLVRALELLEGDGWCQGVFARDRYGRQVNFASPRAVQYCAMGAVKRAAREADPYDSRLEDSAAAVLIAIVGKDPAGWNDRNGHATVLGTFRWALEFS